VVVRQENHDGLCVDPRGDMKPVTESDGNSDVGIPLMFGDHVNLFGADEAKQGGYEIYY